MTLDFWTVLYVLCVCVVCNEVHYWLIDFAAATSPWTIAHFDAHV